MRAKVVVMASLFLMPLPASAQELTPRAYWPAPKGTQILLLGYTYSKGNVVTDPSLPVVGVNSRIHFGLLAYGRTLSLWGRTANLLVELPYSKGVTRGDLEADVTRRDFSGLADISVTLSINLIGAPTLSRADFQQLRQQPRPILGLSARVVAPTGQYDAERLINVGTNRWATKVELGYIHPLNRKWLLELDLGAWLAADNDDFLGVTRQQDPVVGFQMHLIRRIRPGFWAALDLTYFWGGRSTIDGSVSADLQRNARIGATVGVPIAERYVLKLGWSTGVVTESGDDYDKLLVSLAARL